VLGLVPACEAVVEEFAKYPVEHGFRLRDEDPRTFRPIFILQSPEGPWRIAERLPQLGRPLEGVSRWRPRANGSGQGLPRRAAEHAALVGLTEPMLTPEDGISGQIARRRPGSNV
jgi:hypothetical protein